MQISIASKEQAWQQTMRREEAEKGNEHLIMYSLVGSTRYFLILWISYILINSSEMNLANPL